MILLEKIQKLAHKATDELSLFKAVAGYPMAVGFAQLPVQGDVEQVVPRNQEPEQPWGIPANDQAEYQVE